VFENSSKRSLVLKIITEDDISSFLSLFSYHFEGLFDEISIEDLIDYNAVHILFFLLNDEKMKELNLLKNKAFHFSDDMQLVCVNSDIKTEIENGTTLTRILKHFVNRPPSTLELAEKWLQVLDIIFTQTGEITLTHQELLKKVSNIHTELTQYVP